MVVPCDRAVGVIKNVAGVVGGMADTAAAAIAWDALHQVRVGGGELVGRLDRRRRGLHLGWHLVHRQHLQAGGCARARAGLQRNRDEYESDKQQQELGKISTHERASRNRWPYRSLWPNLLVAHYRPKAHAPNGL